eukprot:TRINITY_DN64906_c0_g1_i2.p1 TRINITY_DN64906_c0_g1~~TRINITY_DN64906_c0_g1_i2.p1  ORF type:complete len:103 (-),score=17.65 TRINITY_DN64906_c0_g1_i2:76-384(-)
MDDAVDATIQLMQVPPEKITNRTAYTIQGFTMSPQQLVASIQSQYCNELTVEYEVSEVVQRILGSIPSSFDTSESTKDWGFDPKKKTVDDAVKAGLEVLLKS